MSLCCLLGGLLSNEALIRCIKLATVQQVFELKSGQERLHKTAIKISERDERGGSRKILPPFKIGDRSLLLGEMSSITASQLIVGLAASVSATDFPGWMAPVTIDTLRSASLLHTFSTSFALIFAWIVAGWLSGSLSQRIYLTRLKDAFDVTWQNWISAANVYILYQLILSVLSRSAVTDIQTPLLSGFVAVLIWRSAYFNIDR
jgi:hypothetical protein